MTIIVGHRSLRYVDYEVLQFKEIIFSLLITY